MPTRGTTCYPGRYINNILFQSTCPRGARPNPADPSTGIIISIHVPTRGTTGSVTIHIVEAPFQSTCPRGARPAARAAAAPGDISIHVPTRGTTIHMMIFHQFHHEFQSTCPRGARRGLKQDFPPYGDFNPRAHEGHDIRHLTTIAILKISIHVPTRGTTSIVGAWFRFKKFQSTCPRGARRRLRHFLRLCCHFNPRAHEGHDLQHTGLPKTSIFQSTCPRGARPVHLLDRGLVGISIHVPTRGTTPVPADPEILMYFNPRAHEGHDPAAFFAVRVGLFQSTCPRGARLAQYKETLLRGDFNPRAHEGHDFAALFGVMYSTFQSTCPRGARRPMVLLVMERDTFQSTCPRGARRRHSE